VISPAGKLDYAAMMFTILLIIAIGSFFMGFVNAAFATGGFYIMLAASSAIFPLAVAVPLQPALVFTSLLSRMMFFWAHIRWPIVLAFSAGAVPGVIIGARIFVNLSEAAISLLLGSMLLILMWMPTGKLRIPMKHPFFAVGALHAFMSTLFGVGAIIQSAIFRTSLMKLQISSTMAAALLTMETLKLIGYAAHDFDYRQYVSHIIVASLAGIAGTWAGKRVVHAISERVFRNLFRCLITLMAVRLLVRGWMLS
jgi:uncharacterized membrane protein YfcA